MSDNYKGVYDVRDSYGNIVKNKYCLRITTTVNGVTHRDTFTIEAPNRQKAYDYKVKKIEELKLKYAKGENVQDNMTFAQLVDKWKQTVENKMNKKDSKALSYDTYASYKSSLKNYIIPYLGDKLITNITKGTIRLYSDKFIAGAEIEDEFDGTSKYLVTISNNGRIVLSEELL